MTYGEEERAVVYRPAELIEMAREAELPPLLVSGKFIAVRHLILLSSPLTLHRAMYDVARSLGGPYGDEFLEQSALLKLESLPRLSSAYVPSSFMTDAGMYQLKVDESKIDIVIRQESGDFGRADRAGRQRTAEQFQAELAPYNVAVKNTDVN